MEFWQKLFSGSDFMPRRLCGDWSASLIGLHVVSDATIFLSYLWIPLTMFIAFRSHGNKLVLPRVTWLLISLYITFITACGFTHFFDLLMFWIPVYRINGLVRGFTAVVSFLTAASLARLIPIAITHPMEIDAQQRLVQQQQDWLRDILDSATGGVLRLCQNETDLPKPLTGTSETAIITNAKSLGTVRRMITKLADKAGFEAERTHGLLTAVHEAAMNALSHAGGGTVQCFQKNGDLQIWVEDKGQGIALDKLPIATLKQGYSTIGTAGQGWFLMLSFVDTAYLKTGKNGTTIVLTMNRQIPEPIIPLSQWVGGDITTPHPLNMLPI